MREVIGELLPLALGVAVSPIPIIAAILMLLSPRARVTSVGFLLGWVIGIALATTVFTLLVGAATADPDAAAPLRGTVQLSLGILLLLMAIRNWRSRPKPGEDLALPTWMQAIDTIGFPGAFGLGFALSALNPKNLVMAAGAGTAIGAAGAGAASAGAVSAGAASAGGAAGAAGLAGGEVAALIVVFTVLAASTVLIPVVGYLFAADRLRGALDATRGWLQGENAVIMAVLLLVIGVSMIGKGIGSF
ncbi:GAP family protein [Microbacterium sp.]|uniref:GAP family protein n=1 Tax=Microbacterium sp. TaxID=51671 RepID=UPI003C767661